MRKSWSGTTVALLMIAGFFVAESVQAQPLQLRGPNNGNGKALLLPTLPFAPASMNNGSMQTTQNPNANLPNQTRFINIAAMPLGDRLGNNGVFFDTNLLPNIGLFQGGQFIGQLGQQGLGGGFPGGGFGGGFPGGGFGGGFPGGGFGGGFPGGGFGGGFPGGGFQAARMARQQMILALYGMQVQQAMMMPAGGFGLYNPVGMFGWCDPTTMFGGWYDPTTGNPNPMGLAPPLNNQRFGAGFANGAGGF
jgi:hypothetical protein